MSKVVNFTETKVQDKKNMEGENMFKKAEYFVVGEITGTEVRVPFEGTIYTECEKCGQVIDFDIHELISCENDNEDFTEFGAFTCHECLQKEKQEQATGLGRMGLAILDIMTIVQDELESVPDKSKNVLQGLLTDAFEAGNQKGVAIWLGQARGYADALNDNGLIDDVEHDVLTMAIQDAFITAIDDIQNEGE